MNSPRSSEKRRKNTQLSWAFWSHHAWWFRYQKSHLKALYLGAVTGDRGLLSGTVQTHSERWSLSQRTYSPNRDYEAKRGGGQELETSWLVRGCTVWRWLQRQEPGILLSSPAICCFSQSLFACSNAYWVLTTALKIIVYTTWYFKPVGALHIGTPSPSTPPPSPPALPPLPLPCWTWLPPGTAHPLPALRQFGGPSAHDYKVTFTAEMRCKQREWRRVQLLWNLAVETPSHLATQSQETLCLKDLRLDIGRTVFISC